MAKSLITVSLLATLAATSCSYQSASEKQAAAQATSAAEALIATDHADTIAMQQSILNAKTIQSQYAISGDSDAVKAFDNAFEACLKEKDNNLWQQIFN